MKANYLFFIIVSFLCNGYSFYSYGQSDSYVNYSLKDGLPSENVYMAFQDSKGFMWFGTDAGVSRFDGYTFENFTLSDGLADTDIFDMYEDRTGRLWFATYNGKLCYFENGTFYNSSNTALLKDHDFETYISCIYEDTEGNLWMGSNRNGIQFMDTKGRFHKVKLELSSNIGFTTRTYTIWENLQGDVFALTRQSLENLTKANTSLLEEYSIAIGMKSINQVKKLVLKNENLLITENGNFHLIDPSYKKSLMHFRFDSLTKAVVFLDEDNQGNVWAGSYEGMFQISDSLSGQVTQLSFLRNMTVSSRVVDNQGNAWYTTLQKGIFFTPKNILKHYTWKNGLPEKEVNTIAGNSTGNVLIGQEDYYSFIRNDEINSFHDDPYLQVTGTKYDFEQRISKVYLDDHNNYVICSNYGLIVRKADSIVYYPREAQAFIYSDDDSVWLGCNSHLRRTSLSEMSKPYKYYKQNIKKLETYLQGKRVTDLLWSERTSKLWIGLNTGLQLLEEQEFLDLSDRHRALQEQVNDLLECKDSTHIWIATHGFGILQLNEHGEPLVHLASEEGLSSDICKALAEDSEGNIWIGTDNGLNKLTYIDGRATISKYGINDGLLSEKINDLYIRNDTIWVATDEGLSIMRINNEEDDHTPIHITKISVSGMNLDINENQPRFDYDQNNLLINFAALNYRMGGEIDYRYKIKEDQRWNYTTNTQLEFPSLAGGTYSFLIQAKGKQGIWGEEKASFNFIISPPIWKTWWAYCVYLITVSGIFLAIFRYDMKRKLLTSDLKLEQIKTNFFSNISHEFRTPLTLIVGPLERILASTQEKETKKQIKVIQQSTKGLQHLINQLLDISKIEAGKQVLYLENRNIVEDLNLIAERFTVLTKSKNIHFEFRTQLDEVIMSYDPKKIEIIVNNLLSNAVKFTQTRREIKLIASLESFESDVAQMLKIQVVDTGIGISKDSLANIFDRFYQADTSLSREHEGTGIGLSLTKELVELHEGTISVESKLGTGTTFTCLIPSEIQTITIPDSTVVKGIPENGWIVEESEQERPLVLVVEDNQELRSYIKDILQEDYEVEEAENGKKGVELALKLLPDLILTDVMMPEMNGFELCSQLKNQELTSHIPIILLTAKAATDSRVEGLETGADDYLTKPFNHLELTVRIKNLIAQREALRKRFSQEPNLSVTDIAVSTIDEQFLQRAVQVIENHMTNAHFDVTMFVEEIGLSRTLLHRKLKALTDLSTSEFNRTIRLKRASELLKTEKGTIAEIAYLVGFSDPRYFSKCFKKTFGMSPIEYV